MKLTKHLVAKFLLFNFSLFFCVEAPHLRAISYGDESVLNQVKDDAGDAKVKTKKGVRKLKRKVRKATGTDSTLKDIKDEGKNIDDSVTNGVEKIERKSKK